MLHGRLKEIINRAGEKVSPLEIDDLLLRHPSVAQAVTFAVPHERLGEEVAAAVVLRPDAGIEARALQDFVAQTVAPFKVPRRIVVVDEIPKGPTGKIQRIGLADKLGLSSDQAGSDGRMRQTLEASIAEIWSSVLEIPDVGPVDDFFALGGDSILATEAVARVRDLVGRPDLPIVAIVRAPTPRAMALEIESEFGWVGSGVHRIQDGVAGRPIFFAHGVDGEVIPFAGLARLLGDEQPVYGFQAPGHEVGEEPTTAIESLAARYLEGVRAVQPSGPYLLGAYCMGAAVVLELAHRLEALGESADLVLVDPRIRRPEGARYALWLVPRRARQGRLLGAVSRRLRRQDAPRSATPGFGPVRAALEVAREQYDCKPTRARTALVISADHARYELPDWYLKGVFSNVLSSEQVDGTHVELLRPPAVAGVAAAVSRAIDRLDET